MQSLRLLTLLALSLTGGAAEALSIRAPIPATTALEVRPGLRAGEIELRVEVHNYGQSWLTLHFPRVPEQGCVAGVHVRVLKPGSRAEVPITRFPVARTCVQDQTAFRVQAGGDVQVSRVLTLPPGRYAVEVTLPAVNARDARPAALSAGYIMVTVK